MSIADEPPPAFLVCSLERVNVSCASVEQKFKLDHECFHSLCLKLKRNKYLSELTLCRFKIEVKDKNKPNQNELIKMIQ